MTLRAEFNPECQFVVSTPRGLIVGSSQFKMGAPFDKSIVTTRLLRQLYEARQISVAELEPVPVEAEVSTEPPRSGSRIRRRRFNNGGSS